MSALWPTLADLSHLQQWTMTLLGAFAVLWLIAVGCIWLLEQIADREQQRFQADLEHQAQRRKFNAIARSGR